MSAEQSSAESSAENGAERSSAENEGSVTESSVEVPFAGGVERRAPLAWGQQTTWNDIQFFLPEVLPFAVLGGWLPLELDLTVSDVVDSLSEVLCRHESLRSIYRNVEGWVGEQLVHAAGSIELPVLDLAADATAEQVQNAGAGAAMQILATGFDHEAGRPFRPVLVTRAGVPALLLFGASHVTTDLQGANLLSDELRALLQARADGAPPQPAAGGWQAVDLALSEQSPAGQQLNAAAQEHLRGLLRAARPAMFPVPPDAAERAETPRFWRGQLDSAALAAAVRQVARRQRVSTSVLLLAVTAAIVNTLAEAQDCVLGLVLSNRTSPELRHSMSSVSQTQQASVHTGGASFADVIRSAAEASEETQRHGRFDIEEAARVVREVGAERGVTFDLTMRFNDTWSSLRRQMVRSRPGPAEIRAAAERSTFSWLEQTDSDKITLFVDVFGDDEQVQLRALADTARIPPGEIRGLLQSYETILLRLLTDELTMAEIAEIVHAECANWSQDRSPTAPV